MIDRVFERLALVFVLGAPLAGVLWFFAPYDFEAPSGPVRIALYSLYSLSVTALVFTYYRFIRNSGAEKVVAWLVIAFYVEVFFNVALLGILALLLVRFFHPNPEGGEAEFVFRVLYGLVGSSASATCIGAVAALVGYGRGLLGRRIRPFPFQRRRRRNR